MIRLAFGRNSTLLLKQTKKILNHTKNQQFSFSTTTQKTNETLNPNDREYFYYVNQEGHVYLTDEKISRKPFGPVFYRDPKFLRQMFNLIKQNQTNKYSKLFPFIWICMKERNYVACEDTPIVFSSLNQEDNKIFYGPNLFVSFQPEEVSISSDGRFYHPGPLGYALIKSSLAVELGQSMKTNNDGISTFEWNGKTYTLKQK